MSGLQVWNVVVWKHTQDSKGVSLETNQVIEFLQWANDNLREFEIENLDHHLTKVAKFNRLLTDQPYALIYKLRVWIPRKADMAVFMMFWT